MKCIKTESLKFFDITNYIAPLGSTIWRLSKHTSTIFCGMPIMFSVIFRIHSVMLSIYCVMGIICSVIVIIHSVIFTISSAVL